MPVFPVEKVRQQFPALIGEGGSKIPVFLDNPAGTQLPACTIAATADAMRTASSNLGGYFETSRAADEIWARSHEAMACLLGAKSMREIVVGPSMTSLTFHLSRSIAREFRAGDEIIVTRMDHEGDISPWLAVAEDLDLKIRWLSFNRESWKIEADDLASLLCEKTRLLALNFASNLTGSINDARKLVALARSAGAIVFVDAVQYVPHAFADVGNLGCDFLACSSYKFFGPHLGIVWGREESLAELTPYKCRCASDGLPQRFELGTPQTELLAGLAATVGYFKWLGEVTGCRGSENELITRAYECCTAYETGLAERLISGINSIPGTVIHGITSPNRMSERVPTVSFTHEGIAPAVFARELAGQGICIWSGHNYALEVVRQLGLDEKAGVVRIGIAHYNTMEEIDRTLIALDRVVANYSK